VNWSFVVEEKGEAVWDGKRDRGRKAYAELAEADKKAFIIWKSSKCICWTITVGEYTPAAVNAAPKKAPESTERGVRASMVAPCTGSGANEVGFGL
jgi:hypothetical protein